MTTLFFVTGWHLLSGETAFVRSNSFLASAGGRQFTNRRDVLYNITREGKKDGGCVPPAETKLPYSMPSIRKAAVGIKPLRPF